MADAKKISFGFSKISKKPAIMAPKREENEIQFIDCLEENSIKLVNGEEKVKEALVIPLKNGNILRDNMIEALKARKEENTARNAVIKEKENNNQEASKTIVEINESEKKPLTLDELAAKEILEDLKKCNESDEVKDVREIPASNSSAIGEKESTMDDYENVPINEFGLAMLRGMGWNPDKGIGKNGQVIQPINPIVRPKGMGLGADKVIAPAVRSLTGEELVMKKSALLKIISGPHKNLYGRVEGFDELPGRIMARLALQNIVISISENLVQLVTSEEYNKNSKILNLTDYNKYYEEKDSKNKKEDLKSSIKTEVSDGKHQTQKKQQMDSVNESENSFQKSYTEKNKNITSIMQKKEKTYSSSPERNKKYDKYSPELLEDKRKSCWKKERKTSSDSEEGKQHEEKRMIKCSDHRYYDIKPSKERRNSSSSEDRYQKHKSKKEKRSPSSDSEYEYKSSKYQKIQSRNRSSSSDYEKEKPKKKNKYKSEVKSHSSHPKKKSKHKTSRRDRSSSSDSEIEKKSKDRKYESKKYVSNQRHSRRDKNQTSDSDSEPKQRKYKNYSRQPSTSRSPSRKKKKKHPKSRS